jgi:phosphoesterase RecJ-like protein
MAAAGRLVGTGIDLAAINHRIYNSMQLHQLKLQARAIENLLQTENGEVALTSLSRADFDELECTPVDTEDVVNIPRSLLGVGVAVFLYEFPDEPQTKISLRTAEPYDAAEFCRELGGGGHARAAGCSMDGDIDSVRDAVLQLIHNKWFKDVV